MSEFTDKLKSIGSAALGFITSQGWKRHAGAAVTIVSLIPTIIPTVAQYFGIDANVTKVITDVTTGIVNGDNTKTILETMTTSGTLLYAIGWADTLRKSKVQATPEAKS